MKRSIFLKLLGGIISPFLESPDFVTGMMGAGMSFYRDENGDSVGWIDKFYVRKKAIFQLLSIMETELAGASFLFNSSGARATITKVEFIEKKGIRFKEVKESSSQTGKEVTHLLELMVLFIAVTSLQMMVRKQSRTVSVG